jgi:DNA-binding transcriptional MerR regulator
VTTPPWTIEELSEQVADALAVDYPGQSSGRVRDVPDRRTIRWYTTIGLVDRPAAMRGRTALYERRHLLQLVAIKRLQTEGRTLAQIQHDLVGATDAVLERIADVPAQVAAPAEAAPVEAAPADTAPADAAAAGTAPAEAERAAAAARRATPAQAAAGGPAQAAAGGPAPVRARFWVRHPAVAEPPALTGDQPTPASDWAEAVAEPPVDGRPGALPAALPAGPRFATEPEIVHGIRLGDGVTLLLGSAGRAPDADDVSAIHAAAGPLLDLLRRLDLDRSSTKGTR